MNILRLLPRFRRAYQAFERLDNLRTWSREQIDFCQLTQLNSLWSSAIENVPYYIELAREHNLPSTFSSMLEFRTNVPLLEKKTVRDFPEKFLSSTTECGRWLKTGGSTGIPTRVFWSNKAHLANLQLRYAWMRRFGVDIFDRQGFVWGHAGSFASGVTGFIDRVRQPMINKLRNRLRYNAYKLGSENLDKYLQSMESRAPVSLYGYSSAILLLANRAIETGIKIDSIRLIVLTGEATVQSDQKRIQEAFNTSAKIEYGSVECGLMALESANRELEVQENSRIVETLPGSHGQFDIAVTVLDNPSFPLIRFLIGDTTSAELKIRPDGFAILTDVQGRSNDFLVSRQGNFVHANAVKHVMENISNVARFQAIQNEDGSLRLLIETGHSNSDVGYVNAAKKIQALIGYPVTTEFIEKIPGTLAGKHNWVSSALPKSLRPDSCSK